MKISYAITVKDELAQLTGLCNKLDRWLTDVSYEWEIVILKDDCYLWDEPLYANIGRFLLDVMNAPKYSVHYRVFDDDFATHKNFLNSQCSGDYIFQLDADEYPSALLTQVIDELINQNPGIDLIWVPRINTVTGLTTEHIQRWGWRTEMLENIELPAINWPDHQSRIFRNSPDIKWEGKVHEQITGAMKYSKLPAETEWALHHHKDIAKQMHQNEKYATIQR